MSSRLAVALALVATLAVGTSNVASADRLDLTFTTTPTQSPRYAPRNVLAVWVEDSGGAFVRTLVRFAQRRVKYLRAWNATAEDISLLSTLPDVVTGATRSSHGTLSATWDLTDMNGGEVPDGSYTVRMELADRDSTSATVNNQGSFTFEKNGQSLEQSGLAGGGFVDVTLRYEGDGADPGDPGNPGGSCSLVAACVDDDGCCLPDCVFEVDNDCDPTTGRDVAAGCSAGGSTGGGALLLLLGVLGLVALRPRGC